MLLLVPLAALVIVGVVVVAFGGALRAPSRRSASDARSAVGGGVAVAVGIGALVALVLGGIVVSVGARDRGDGTR